MDLRTPVWALAALLGAAALGCDSPGSGAAPSGSAATSVQSAVTVRCQPVDGRRLFVRNEKFETTRSELGGKQPMFLFDPAAPETLYVFASDSKRFGLLSPDKGESAELLELSGERIVAHLRSADESWLYTIFPSEGFGTFSRHEAHGIMGPTAESFVSRCEVQGGPLG